MGTPVITLTFQLSPQVNKSSRSRNSDATTPCTSHPSAIKVTKIDTCSKPSTLLEILLDTLPSITPKYHRYNFTEDVKTSFRML